MTEQVLSREAMTRQQVLDRTSITQFREVPINHKMRFAVHKDSGRLITLVGGEVVFVSESAVTQISSRLKAQAGYIAKCPPDLQAINLNYWAEHDSPELRAIVDTTQELPTVSGFVRAGAPPLLDMDAVLSALEDALGPLPELSYIRAVGRPEHVSVSIVGPKEGQPKRGDVFRAGVSFDYSPSDRFGIAVSGFNYRLVCANGAYAQDDVAKMSRRHAPDNVYEWIAASAAEVWDKADEQFKRLRSAAESVMPDGHLGEVLQQLYGEFAVPLAARERIGDYILREGVETMYDLINAMTFVATHIPEITEDTGLQVRLMRSAGAAAAHSDLCASCHRPV